jgi:hypothetical protein
MDNPVKFFLFNLRQLRCKRFIQVLAAENIVDLENHLLLDLRTDRLKKFRYILYNQCLLKIRKNLQLTKKFDIQHILKAGYIFITFSYKLCVTNSQIRLLCSIFENFSLHHMDQNNEIFLFLK